MTRHFKKGCFFVLLWLTLSSVAYAHPHIFVEYQMKLVFDSEKMRGINAHWQLDLMNSQLIMDEFDTNKDGRLVGVEVREVADSMRENLKSFSYFTQVRLNGHIIPVRQVQNIRVKYANKRIIYDLHFPCPVPLSKQKKELTVTPVDHTNYVAFSPMKGQAIGLRHPANTEVKVVTQPRKMYDSTRFTIAKK